MMWLYLHFPCLQLDSIAEDAPTEAIVVVEQTHNTIVQLNDKAKQLGVRLGMGMATAASLVNNLQVLPYDSELSRQRLTKIAHHLYIVSADIALMDEQGLVLRIDTMLKLYNDVSCYWQQIERDLTSLNLTVYFATGYTPYAAQVLAQQQVNVISDNRAELKEHLNRQRVTSLGLSEKQKAALQRIGVLQVGQLVSLSLADLAKRFDITFVNYIGRLTGQLVHSLTFFIPHENFTAQCELAHEIEQITFLSEPVAHLLGKLAHFLITRNQVCSELYFIFTLRDQSEVKLNVISAEPLAKAQEWQNLVDIKLATLTLSSPVIVIKLFVTNTQAAVSQNQDFLKMKRGNVNALISMMIAKLGQERVCMPIPTADHRPENANRLVCISDLSMRKLQLEKGERLRPSILLPTPLQLRQPMKILQGPERVEAGWWDDRVIIRDYFIAHNQQGQCYWLFRDQRKLWFEHGLFC